VAQEPGLARASARLFGTKSGAVYTAVLVPVPHAAAETATTSGGLTGSPALKPSMSLHLTGIFGAERRTEVFASAATKLMRTYVSQVEVLRRLRQGGSQFVRVEHVHVNEGGHAIIGNVTPGKKNDGDKNS